MAYVVPAMKRPMGWLGKEEALRWPVLGWAMRHNGVFGVAAAPAISSRSSWPSGWLDEGRVLAIFPEGTRLPDRSPAGGEGAPRCWPSGARRRSCRLPSSDRDASGRGPSFLRARRRMTVRVGEPFTLTMPRAPTARESLRAATIEMMATS